MPRLCRPRDQVFHRDDSEVRSSTAIQNPTALVGYLFSRPVTTIRGPAIVFVEPLRDARENKCQGVAPGVPHVGVQKADISVSVHVIVVGWTECWVRYDDLG